MNMINETIEPKYKIVSNKNFTFFKTIDLVNNTQPLELFKLLKTIQIIHKLDPNDLTDKQVARKILIKSINNN